MAGNYTEIQNRPNNKKRQEAYQMGVGFTGVDGNSDQYKGRSKEELRTTSLPTQTESS